MYEKEFLINFCYSLAEEHIHSSPPFPDRRKLIWAMVEMKYFDLPPPRARHLRLLISRSVTSDAHSSAAKAIMMRNLDGMQLLSVERLARVFASRTENLGLDMRLIEDESKTHPKRRPYSGQEVRNLAHRYEEDNIPT